MSSFYCFSLSFHKDKETKKIKLDYSLIPVKFVDTDGKLASFSSMVSDEEPFSLKKEKREFYGCEYFTFFKVKKDVVKFVLVLETSTDDLEQIENYYLPKIEKKLRWKIFFRFAYKAFLRERIKRILNSENS